MEYYLLAGGIGFLIGLIERPLIRYFGKPKVTRKSTREEVQYTILKQIKAYEIYRHSNDFNEQELIELEFLIDSGYVAVKKRSRELFLTDSGNLKLEVSMYVEEV